MYLTKHRIWLSIFCSKREFIYLFLKQNFYSSKIVFNLKWVWNPPFWAGICAATGMDVLHGMLMLMAQCPPAGCYMRFQFVSSWSLATGAESSCQASRACFHLREQPASAFPGHRAGWAGHSPGSCDCEVQWKLFVSPRPGHTQVGWEQGHPPARPCHSRRSRRRSTKALWPGRLRHEPGPELFSHVLTEAFPTQAERCRSLGHNHQWFQDCAF